MPKDTKKIIILFVLGSFIGWLIEKVIFKTNLGYSFFQKTLGLNLPLLPIYGFGLVILFFSSKYVNKKKYSFVQRGFINGFILSIFELLSGIVTTYIFKVRFWEYSSKVLNIDGHINLIAILGWIILGFAYEIIEGQSPITNFGMGLNREV